MGKGNPESYRNAGVSLQSGYEAVRRIKDAVARAGAVTAGGIGGFGSLYDLGEDGYRNPVIVSSTDGVGTKLKIAGTLGIYDTIGIDAVAMCVNDIICHGARPLFFLDYIAMGRVEPSLVEQLVTGMLKGCEAAGCALTGGETAEMPGIYAAGDFDIAGFATGVVEKEEVIDGKEISEGDAVIALGSSGVHSNGFSLVRKIIADCGLDLTEIYPEISETRTLGETLLTPTEIYVRPILALMRKVKIKGIAHITGGGIYENLPRILPEGLAAEIDTSTWEIPAIFSFIEKKGKVPRDEMYNIFNMGIGMIVVVSREDADVAIRSLKDNGLQAWEAGKIVGDGGEEQLHLVFNCF